MNLYICIGNLTKEPELRYTEAGKAICKFSIAINEGYGDNKKTTFMNIVAFDKKAESCGNYLSIGSKVSVRGRINNGSYTDREGVKRYTTDVIADEVEFLTPKSAKNEAPEQEHRNNGFVPIPDDVGDEGLPFN